MALTPKAGAYPELHVADLPPVPVVAYWFSPRGDDHLLVARVADALARYPGSPLAGLSLDDRERCVKRILALVEESGYVVRRGAGE